MSQNVKHTEGYWAKVDSIASLILEKPEYFKRERYKALVSIVMQQFELQEAQAKNYVSMAKKRVGFFHKAKKEKAREQVLVGLEALTERALESGTPAALRLAAQLYQERCKLLDLYPAEKTKNENITWEVDLNKFTEKGLERLKRGDDPAIVMLDPESIIIQKGE